jgi:hypothetical protein
LKKILFLFCLAFAKTTFAQHAFQTNAHLKLYAEPSVHTQIMAIVQSADSINVIRQTEQEGHTFLRVTVLRKATDKINPIKIGGFICTNDLDKNEPQTLDILTKIKKQAFVNIDFLVEYKDEDKQVKVATVTAFDKNKTVLQQQTRFADDFFGTKTHINAVIPTNLHSLYLENDDYLRCRIKNWKPDADNNYTIKMLLRKRNVWNKIFRPSKVLSIDSISGKAHYAAIQAIRKRDSCIVWHADDSHTRYKWSGGCKDGYANGYGTLQLDTNRIFKGTLAMGMMQGEGVLRDNAWLISGTWQQGELQPNASVETVLWYKNSPPARDTTTYKMYPTVAPLTKWYAERNTRLREGHWKHYTRGYRRNDVFYPYLPTSYQLILPDNENPAYKQYKNNECVNFTTWKYADYQRVGVLFGDAPFYDVWCSKKNMKAERDARIYYWANDNKWYWWGLTYSSVFPTFADAVKTACGCKH